MVVVVVVEMQLPLGSSLALPTMSLAGLRRCLPTLQVASRLLTQQSGAAAGGGGRWGHAGAPRVHPALRTHARALSLPRVCMHSRCASHQHAGPAWAAAAMAACGSSGRLLGSMPLAEIASLASMRRSLLVQIALGE